MSDTLLRWHRRIGAAAAIFVAVLAITGVALNHQIQLGLDRQVITSALVVNWYAPRTENEISYHVRDRWITWLDGRVFFDGRPTGETIGAIHGAVTAGPGFTAVAGRHVLLLLGPRGKLIERIAPTDFSGEIERIGVNASGQVAVQTAAGRFLADRDLVSWSPTALRPRWARPSSAPVEIRRRTIRAYLGGGVPLSKVLLDIHTGRMLGTWGSWIMDAAAIGLLLLAATGVINWLRSRRTAPRRAQSLQAKDR